MSAPPHRFEEPSTASSLLRGVSDGRPEAWADVVEHFSGLVYNQCRRTGLTPEQAADVTQETFAAAYSAIQGFQKRRDSDSLRKWLQGIARNKVRDFFRHQQKQLASAEGGTKAAQRLRELAASGERAAAAPASGALEPGNGALRVKQALAIIEGDFQQHTWKAFWQTAIHERPARDVALELNMSPEAVRKAKSRVLERLRSELSEMN